MSGAWWDSGREKSRKGGRGQLVRDGGAFLWSLLVTGFVGGEDLFTTSQ